MPCNFFPPSILSLAFIVNIMDSLNTELVLIIVCCLVVVSFLFTIASRFIRIPAVLLLLFAGIAFREISNYYDFTIGFPDLIVRALGVVGLIMIVLEAGLDLKIGKEKIKVIRNSFFSAFVILVVSAALVTFLLRIWLNEPVQQCLVYAIPLSIMSSSIIIPSIHLLSDKKKEFLVYEASFSDILGILFFNFFTSGEGISVGSVGNFGLGIVISLVLSLVLSFLLLFILAKTNLNIKFFLIFSLLVLIYAAGKLFHLPSLLMILVFGLMICNWEKLRFGFLHKIISREKVDATLHLMHSITAETSFLVRTFFFFLFGYSISLGFLTRSIVIQIGAAIIVILFLIRFLYLRFFLRTNVFPETFFIPRGLVTIVLFFKIPVGMRLTNFDEGILFFIIVTSGIIMSLGMLFYRKKPDEIIDEGQFSERSDIL